MERFSNSLILQFPSQITGNAAAGVQVTVKIAGTNTLATLYATDNTAGATKSNPTTTDSKGFYSFYAADGKYTLEFNNGFPSLEMQLVDVAEIRSDFDALEASNELFKDEQQANYDAFVLSQGWDQVGTFAAGFTYTSPNQVGQDVDGNWWRWNGSFPKTVTAGILPSSDPDYKLVGDGVLRSDLADGSADIGGVSAGSLPKNANIENYGASSSAIAATNTTAINDAVAANGFGVIPRRSAAFATNLGDSFDYSILRGDGVITLASGAIIDLQKASKPILQNQPTALMSKYARGAAVKFVAYGDSIVEGVASTGHTANTGLNTFQPDYAWPTLIQHLARQQNGAGNGDLNFRFYNAGWAGQRLDNAWAFNNFKSKVLDVYPDAQCVVIAFGHNDGNAAGSNTADYIRQLKNLILLSRGNGIEPVLVSTIPCARPRGQDIFNEIYSVQKQVCEQMQVQFFNVFDKYQSCINYYGYFDLISSDGVHPIDAGYNVLASAIYSELFRPWVWHKKGKLSLWEPEAKGLILSGNLDASWASGVTYVKDASSIDMNIYYNTAKGADQALAAVYVWNDSPNKCKLIYRASYPAENNSAGTGLVAEFAALKDGIFYSPSGASYASYSDVGGRRRGVTDYSDAPCVLSDAYPVGMTFLVLKTGPGNAALRYASHFELYECSAAAEFAGQQPAATGVTKPITFNAGSSYYRLPNALSGISIISEPENLNLDNVVSFLGNASQVTVNADLPEGSGFILMSGNKINAAGKGRWVYALVRGLTGAAAINDPTKLYLVRWQTGDAGYTILATSTATAQPSWTDIKFFVSLDSTGDNYRVRVFDGLASSAGVILTYTSTVVTNGTTTRSEAPPIAGVSGGALRIGTVTGGEAPVEIKKFMVQRYI